MSVKTQYISSCIILWLMSCLALIVSISLYTGNLTRQYVCVSFLFSRYILWWVVNATCIPEQKSQYLLCTHDGAHMMMYRFTVFCCNLVHLATMWVWTLSSLISRLLLLLSFQHFSAVWCKMKSWVGLGEFVSFSSQINLTPSTLVWRPRTVTNKLLVFPHISWLLWQ